jgi:ABC-type Fe3+-hydroxamate transport system substrate-binding protein
MKKLIVLAIAAVLMSSCTTITKTATSKPVKTEVITSVLADLDVSPDKVTYYYVPTNAVHKAGVKNILNSAIREALAANGDADVFVGLEYEVKSKRYLFLFTVVERIVISGYPAKYKNFRSPSDDKIIELHIGDKIGSSSKTGFFFNKLQ